MRRLIKNIFSGRLGRIAAKNMDYNTTATSPLGGGLINPISGAGTDLDKNSLSYFSPTRFSSKNQLETIYVESWAAGKFIDIPVDDMFIRWRELYDMDKQDKILVEKAEKQFKIRKKLSMAMKSGRLYGTGLFIILTKEAPPEKPLNIDRIMPGDLQNILSVDRFDANILRRNNNIFSPNYGQPEFYTINTRNAGIFRVHHSRVIRFDGIKPMTDNSFQSYDDDWGVPSIVPVITEIFQDGNVAKGVAHLVSESSVPVQKVDGFEDAISGGGDDISLTNRMLEVTRLRSIYRTLFMDSEDSFERHDVTFSGLPEVMDRNATRLAAASKIPATRFWGKSATGMNATGEGDERDYAKQVSADQENILTDPLEIIDSILEKHLCLSNSIIYRFPSIMDQSDDDRAAVLLKKTQAIVPLVNSGIITEDEARAAMDGDDILGDLKALPDGMEGVEEFKKNLAELQAKEQWPGNA